MKRDPEPDEDKMKAMQARGKRVEEKKLLSAFVFELSSGTQGTIMFGPAQFPNRTTMVAKMNVRGTFDKPNWIDVWFEYLPSEDKWTVCIDHSSPPLNPEERQYRIEDLKKLLSQTGNEDIVPAIASFNLFHYEIMYLRKALNDLDRKTSYLSLADIRTEGIQTDMETVHRMYDACTES